MAEEGIVTSVMEMSHYIGTPAAIHYCGLTISNIAVENRAQELQVAVGALTVLMKWMEHQMNANRTPSPDSDNAASAAHGRVRGGGGAESQDALQDLLK